PPRPPPDRQAVGGLELDADGWSPVRPDGVGSAGGGHELDADAADGVQVPGPGGRLAELAAQPGDVYVDGLVAAAVRLAPHVGEQLPAADHPAGALGEVGEQVELAAGQAQRGTVQHRLP